MARALKGGSARVAPHTQRAEHAAPARHAHSLAAQVLTPLEALPGDGWQRAKRGASRRDSAASAEAPYNTIALPLHTRVRGHAQIFQHINT